MLRFPVMVAAGGINSAGRTSQRHAYRRMIWDQLDAGNRCGTEAALAQLMGVEDAQTLLAHTLVREIEPEWFDHRAVPWHRPGAGKEPVRLQPRGNDGWHCTGGRDHPVG